MIAKVVSAPKGGGRFGNLGAYVGGGRRQAVGLGPEGQGEAWSRLGSYVLDQARGGEKVAASWVRNCGTDELGFALKAVELTQRCAPERAGGTEGKTLHVVVSFAPGERLDLDTMKAIEVRVAKTLGLEEHQRVAGIHQNTDCWHMHIAINKVHPNTLRTVTPYRAWPKLRALSREIEREHGLKETRLSREAERYLSEGAARVEAHAGRESFATWARENGREALLTARDTGPGWQAVHEAAARLGMEIKPRAAGLVLSPAGVRGYGIKASSIDRGLGIKAMTDRLGPYEPPLAGRELPGAETRYTSEPLQKGTAARALSAEYERVRAQALADRDRAFKAMQAEQGDYRQRLDAWAKAERERIRHGRFSAFDPDKYGKLRGLDRERRRKLAEAKEARRTAGEAIRTRNQIPTWQSFLEKKAHGGDELALATLRERQAQNTAIGETVIAADTATKARHVVRIGIKRTVRRDGTVAYQLRDGGLVLDRSGRIEIATESRGAAEFGLELAEQRFGSGPLTVTGSDQFKAWTAEAAARDGSIAQFKDPALERSRAVLIAERRDAQDLEDVTAQVAAEQALQPGVSPLQYQTWLPSHTGVFTYEGRAQLRDGTHAHLWRRGDQMLVQRETEAMKADTPHLTRGEQVEIGRDGHVREADRGRGR